MSPRIARDVAAIGVTVRSADLGSGLPGQGGGPLRGGLTLMNSVTADIDDPDVPYAIAVTIAARDGWLACESLTVAERSGGPLVTSAAVRSLGLSLYVRRVREELEGSPYISRETSRTEHAVSWDLPVTPDDWDGFSIAQLRHRIRLTPELAAAAYLDALASPDPDVNRRPTAAAAEKLGASRGHVSRLVSQARRMGVEGLGPRRPARGKDAAP